MRTVLAALTTFGLLGAFSGSAGISQVTGVARFAETPVTHAAAGDLATAVETWRTRVTLAHKAQVVGTGAIACVRVDNSTSIRECVATYILPRGRIQLAGEIITRAAYQLAITGGSGVYFAAGGLGLFNNGRITFLIN